jgi:uncharacterized protein DUF6624
VGAAIVLAMALAGCAPSPPAEPTPSAPLESTAEPTEMPSEIASHEWPTEFDQALHDELVAMLARDQAGREGGEDLEGDRARTERLLAIVDEHGWPTIALVGKDGEDAAWAIAQHSDLDPAAQAYFLQWLEAAVDAGEASPGNLAYLHDRVAVAAGEPQRYGTQVQCAPGGPVPATPLEDEAAVEHLRADAGLDPYADYLDEMTAICEQVEG